MPTRLLERENGLVMVPVTFRGAVVRTAFSNGLMWERLIIGPDSVTLKPWLRAGTTVGRSDVQAVEFVKVRLPLNWSTLIRFRLTDGTLMRRKFNAVRTGHVRQTFVDLGWTVCDVDWRTEAAERVSRRLGKQ